MVTEPSSVPRWRQELQSLLQDAADDVTVRFAQLATVDAEGLPANRTVVVRRILPETGHVVVATDVRSRKVAQLQVMPNAALCWYLSLARVQFRILGKITILGPGAEEPQARTLRQEVWQSLGRQTQSTFYGPPPSAPATADDDADVAADEPSSRIPPASFGVLVLEPTQVDQLDLNFRPHQRVLHRRRPDGAWHSTLLNP